MKHALVFGGSGQAGSYLVEQLLADGYQVTSTHHNTHNAITGGWKKIENHHSFYLEANGHLAYDEIRRTIKKLKPDVIFNLIGELFAPDSWNAPQHYFEVNGGCVLAMLETIRRECPETRFVNAGSADMYGIWRERFLSIFDERTPRSPYGFAKSMAYDAVRVYRQEKGLKCCTAIFFNMESPRRSDFFFAEQVARDVVRFVRKEVDKIVFGDLSGYRDWGWAPEYMEAMRKMADQERMKDFIIATGESHSCREFVQEALCQAGAPVGFSEKVVEDVSTQNGVKMYASTIHTEMELGWRAKYKFRDVVRMLVEAEMKKEKTVTA